MYEILKQLLTGKDNETHDMAKYLGLVTFVIGISLEVYSIVWRGEKFSFQEYGTGLGLLFAGYGAALKLGESSQPEKKV